LVKLNKFNGNPIGLELPEKVELAVTYTDRARRRHEWESDEAGAAGDRPRDQSAAVHQEGEKVKVYTETREFAGRA